MFERVDLSNRMKKEEYRMVAPPLKARLGELQRAAREAGIPILVVFEGWDPVSMAFAINRFLLPLDPRGFTYYHITAPEGPEQHMPFMWRFCMRAPWKGSIAVFDRSWYSRAVTECLDEGKCKALPQDVIGDIVRFEKALVDDGTVIIKIFLHTTKVDHMKPQKRAGAPEACGLVHEDLDSERLYRKNLPLLETMIKGTDLPHAPWLIVEADDPGYAEVKAMKHVIECMGTALNGRTESRNDLASITGASPRAEVDMTVTLPDDQYKEQLGRWQATLREAQCDLYNKKKSLIIVYEGRDASGKGGNINRMTQALNPRTYQVVPTGAPNDMELAHHYLWRFQRRMPMPGHICIFDRSWYGRVLVERVDSLAREDQWQRAYQEINDFERWLVDNGIILVKLWLEVDKEVQLSRFKERMDDPQKTWKITPEDWAAREKWDAYTAAIDEMLERTSTTYAPWTVVASNDKNHARIKTLRAIVAAMKAVKDQ
jgi:polyphosphate:AMP phosphotransferase